MPWSPNTKRSRRAQKKEKDEAAQRALDERMLAKAPVASSVLKPPMPAKSRKSGGDYGNHQATLNFQMPEHVASITISRDGDDPVGDEKLKVG